ncbi:hypothetical protein [uncultured Phocaeicola sp.]|uniref:hypothetical protein n=1 Tax=uncultured Phocaeicola sp. TaxID=990718 RepID=UPI0015B1EF55|nr:hypothetical protein [uncultured Phocaeicola sp.]
MRNRQMRMYADNGTEHVTYLCGVIGTEALHRTDGYGYLLLLTFKNRKVWNDQ